MQALKNNDSETPDFSAEELQEIRTQTAELKKTLKRLSKNQLIQLLLVQVNYAIEQQNINKVLLTQIRESQLEDSKEVSDDK